MSNTKDAKRPHSEVDPDTPPSEFSMLKMKIVMEELFEKHFQQIGMEEMKNDLKCIKKDMPTLRENMDKMNSDLQAMEHSVDFIEKNSKEAKAAATGAIKEVESLKMQVNQLEEELKKEKEKRIALEYEQR